MRAGGDFERRGSRQARRRAAATGSGDAYKKIKDLTDGLTSVTTVGYRVAAGIGALATFAYLRLIQYFPSGMTPGEVLFFLFIAFAFAITYLLMIGYGAFSTLWIVKAITLLRNFASYDDAALVSRLFNDHAQHTLGSGFYGRWQSIRMRAARARIDNVCATPTAVQGWYMGLCSLFVFVYIVVSAIIFNSVPFAELVISIMVAGFVALMLTLVRPESAVVGVNRTKFIGLALAPAIILVLFAGKPLLNIVFEGLGIYAPNVSVELPASEIGVVERASDHIGRPLVDCHRPSPTMILVHGADVLWTGIGDQTVIRFSGIDAKPRTLFSPEPDVRQVQLKFDTKSLRIIKTKPGIDPCFTLSSDLLFKSDQPSLTVEGTRSLSDLAEAVKRLGQPEKIVVRAHSDVRFNINGVGKGAINDDLLSQQRAAAVASNFRSLLNNKATQISSEGVGSHEIRNRCDPDAKSSPYEITMCNKANRRVEISVEYRK
jgi:outer membrane protein OmpA-like peptidoglycan-associated protein